MNSYAVLYTVIVAQSDNAVADICVFQIVRHGFSDSLKAGRREGDYSIAESRADSRNVFAKPITPGVALSSGVSWPTEQSTRPERLGCLELLGLP
jgi:hypothetical protein